MEKYYMTQPASTELNINLWLERVEDDELNCRSILKHRDAPPGPMCFWAQQMAELSLKALLIHHSKKFPKVHDLKKIATLLEPFVPKIFSLEEEFNILNKFYTTTRYPGDFPEGFSWKDAEEAFAAATLIKEFVLKKLAEKKPKKH